MAFREGVQNALNRVDLLLGAAQDWAAYQAGPGSIYKALWSAARLRLHGQTRLIFDGPEQYDDGRVASTGRRAVGAQFERAALGRHKACNVDPSDLGRYVTLSVADATTKATIAQDGIDAVMSRKFARSFAYFCRDIEILAIAGVAGAGGMHSAGNPFDAVLCPDVAAGAMSGSWALDTSDPVADIEQAATLQHQTCGAMVDTLFMSTTVLRRLRRHPAMTGLFGGNVGFGGLGDEQVVDAFRPAGVRQIYAGLPGLYGQIVTVCVQGNPGSELVSDPNGNTLIYGYDAEPDTGEYGIMYTEEHAPGTAGREIRCLAHAYCGIGINPIGGRRITAVLA